MTKETTETVTDKTPDKPRSAWGKRHLKDVCRRAVALAASGGDPKKFGALGAALIDAASIEDVNLEAEIAAYDPDADESTGEDADGENEEAEQ